MHLAPGLTRNTENKIGWHNCLVNLLLSDSVMHSALKKSVLKYAYVCCFEQQQEGVHVLVLIQTQLLSELVLLHVS